MNPEEGELRPQLLDRFGLAVEVRRGARRRDAGRGRAAAARVRRRPGGFTATVGAPRRPSGRPDRRCAGAGRRVVLPDAELRRIAAVCAAFGVDGMRADLVMARAAARTPLAGGGRGRPRRTCGPRPAWRCRTGGAAIPSTRRASTSRARRGAGARPRGGRDRPGRRPRRRGPAADRRTRARRRSARGRPPGRRRRRTPARRTPRPGRSGRRRTARGAAGTAGERRPAGRRRPTRATPRRGDRRPRRAATRPDLLERAAASARVPPGRRSRARTELGRVVRAPAPPAARRRHAPAATMLAAAPHQRARGRGSRAACCAATTCARRCARAGRATSCCSSWTPPARWPRGSGWRAVKAAVLSLLLRRLPAARQGRPDHLPRARAPSWCCRRPRQRRGGRGAAADAARPAGARRWPAGCARAARCCAVERLRDPRRRPLLVVVTDGRATGRPPAATRSRRCRARRAAGGRRRGPSWCGLRERAGAARPGRPARRAAAAGSWSGSASCRSTGSPTSSAPPGALQEGSYAAGTAVSRARRRAHHPSAPQPAAARRPHRRRQGQVDGGVRAGAARLEPGLADRGVPVREVGEVEGRRGGGVPGARPLARRDRRGRARRVAQDGRRLVLGAQGGHGGRPRRPGRRGLGRDPPPDRGARPTRCTCSTSSRTR